MKKYIDAEAVIEVAEAMLSVTGDVNIAKMWQQVKDLPAADVVEVRHYLSEWCTDCKEYDKERHCCPRFNRVIEETVAEMKSEGWQKVRHGRWVWGMQDLCYYCSECDYMGVTEEYPFCPNCGAQMVNEDE